MKRFVGVSLVSLLFVSAHAESEFVGSSWSLQMSQSNDEPIQVQSERKEFDKTGVTLHRRSRGIIENGVYKPIDGDDINASEQEGPFKLKFPRPKGNEQDLQKRNFDKDEHNRAHWDHRGSWDKGSFSLRNLFRKRPQQEKREADFHNKDLMQWPQMSPRDDRNLRADHPRDDEMQSKLRNRSRVSFYRPVERMFEKLFGGNSDKKHENGHGPQDPRMHGHPFGPEQDRDPRMHGHPFGPEQNKDLRMHGQPFGHGPQDPRMQRQPFGPEQDRDPRMQHGQPDSKMQRMPGNPEAPRGPMIKQRMDRRQLDQKRLEDYLRRQQVLQQQMRELEESFFADFYGEED